MFYWHPKVKDLPIPQPKTRIWLIPEEWLVQLRQGNFPNSMINELKKANPFGYPVFIRTDQASDKHSWDKAAYVENEDKLWECFCGTVEHNLCAGVMGLPFFAIVFREYIPMDSGYTAFYGHMPVNPERRYFVEDGKVICHHPYWILEAIDSPSIENWKEVSEKMNTETQEEIELLTKYAEMVSDKVTGCWSVDFCRAKTGQWILIDMAVSADSWHPENCPNEQKIRNLPPLNAETGREMGYRSGNEGQDTIYTE